MSERGGILSEVGAYYTSKLRDHGATPRGVDWNSADSQALRFDRLLEVCRDEAAPSIIDYGCGYGALADHLRSAGRSFRYQGFDISAEMVAAARARHQGRPESGFVADESQLAPADYALAGGIFNVRLGTPDEVWSAYLRDTLVRLDALGVRGFAFDALSLYSDPERRRPDLYYADPLALFDHCKRTFSPRVALLHDYPLYEFTILVRKAEGDGQAGDRRGR